MIAGGNATLTVADVGRALRFYVETLGFKLRGDASEEWAEVDAGEGLVIGLHRARESGGKPGVRGSIAVGLVVNQPIAEVVAVLENRGVKFQGGVRGEAGVKLAFFEDVDGNALYLAEAAR